MPNRITEPVRQQPTQLAEEKLITSQMTQVFGDSGTTRYSGYFQEEPNVQWRDNARIDIVEEMRRGDGAVKAVLNAIKAPILSTEWRIESKDETPRGEEIRAFIEEDLFSLDREWREFVREAFSYLDFGHYAFEQVYEIVEGKVILKDLAPRIPSSIMSWQTADKKAGIQQIIRTDEAEGKPSIVSIPMSKLLVLTNDKEGDDITGQSILRPAYIHYKNKNVLYRLAGIAADRYGVGVPVVKLPESYSADEKNAAEEMVKELRSNERSYIVLPFGFELDIKTPDGNPMGTAISESIEHHNTQIITSTLTSFLGLGSTSAGSFALVKGQMGFFLKHVEDKAHYFVGQINNQVIKRLVILNFGEQEIYPQLRFSPLGDIDQRELSEVINVLAMAGFVEKRPKDEVWARQTFKLPELTDEEIEEMERKAEEEPEEPIPIDGEPEEPDEEEEEPEEPAKELSDHFLEQRSLVLPRRLTEQEQRINFQKLNEQFNDLETELENELAQATGEEAKRYADKVKSALDTGDIAAIVGLTFLLLGRTRKAISKAIREAYEVGKTGIIGELGIPRPPTPGMDAKLMGMDADDLARGYVFELERKSRGLIKDAVSAGANPIAIQASVFDTVKDDAAKMIANVSGTVVGQYVNRGRNRVLQENLTRIVSVQRSEVLDMKTCPMCLSLDKRVVKPDDPIAQMDIAHSHCRGVWVPILMSDADQPKIAGIPKSITSRFTMVDGRPTVNAFKQLKKPIQKKSNAEAQAVIRRKMGV